jgi:spore germination protein
VASIKNNEPNYAVDDHSSIWSQRFPVDTIGHKLSRQPSVFMVGKIIKTDSPVFIKEIKMETISSRQIMLLICAMTLNATLISIPSLMAGTAKQDAVFSYPIAALVILFSWWLISKIMRRFPNQDLFQAVIARFPFLGRIISSMYLLFFFVILIRDIRSLTSFINYALLPRTPIIFIALIIGLCMALTARSGIEIVGRMTEIYQTFTVVVGFLLPFLLIKETQFSFLQPFFEFGISKIFQASWYSVAYIGEIIAIPFIVSNKDFPFRPGVYGLLIGVTLLEILLIFCLTVLNPELTSRFVFPNYHLVREIRVTDFLDRFDMIIVGIWMPAIIVKISVNHFIVCHGIMRIIPQVSAKIVSMEAALLAAVCSLWFFPDYIQIYRLNSTWPALALQFEVLFPILLFFILKPKGSVKVKG